MYKSLILFILLLISRSSILASRNSVFMFLKCLIASRFYCSDYLHCFALDSVTTAFWLVRLNISSVPNFALKSPNRIFIFNVLLTVHHAMILGNCPTWCTNYFQFIYLFIVLYMFRACHAHHQEKQIVSIQLLVIVTPCWWQCRVLVGGIYYWAITKKNFHMLLRKTQLDQF